MFIGVAAALGLLVGSFLNVVIYRVPLILERQWREQCAELAATGKDGCAGRASPTDGLQSESDHARSPTPDQAAHTGASDAPPKPQPFNLIVPRSACPKCKAPITALQNVPILSYLILRGRCAGCGNPISIRYPVIEGLTGVLSALVAWKLGFGLPALGGLVLAWFLLALAFIDIDAQYLPDSLTLPL